MHGSNPCVTFLIDKPVALHPVRCERRDGDLRSMKYEPSADGESSQRLDGRDAKDEDPSESGEASGVE